MKNIAKLFVLLAVVLFTAQSVSAQMSKEAKNHRKRAISKREHRHDIKASHARHDRKEEKIDKEKH